MITGSLVALVTPMREDGQIDWPALHALVEFHIKKGTDGLVVIGTTGENVTLTTEEQLVILARVVDQVGRRIPVIAGTGSNSTAKSIEMSNRAKALGVDACLLVTPYYNKPTQEGLYQHYIAIAEKVEIPHILYNVPGRTGVDLLPETVQRLSEIPNIIGIKEATGDLLRAAEIRERCGPDFMLYSGDDATAMEFMLQGGSGVISVVNNVVPDLMADLCAAAIKGNRATAQDLNSKIEGLSQTLFIEANPTPVKWVLEQMGLIKSGIRLPLLPLSAEHHHTVKQSMQQAGILV